MNLASTISLSAGGQGSGCHGPNCGRHKFGVGQRVRRNPKVAKQWATDTPINKGTVVSQEIIKDNKGKEKLGYKVLSDQDAEDLKNPNLDKWDRPNPKGVSFLEEELVPEKK